MILLDGQKRPLGFDDRSKILWEHLKTQGYINGQGKIQDTLKKALKDSTLVLPTEFEPLCSQITEILRKLSGRLEIKNADERKQGRARQTILQSAEFKALWDRIKYKTTYRVNFDNESLFKNVPEQFKLCRLLPRRIFSGEKLISSSVRQV